jgi:hypothetical protein
VVRCKQENQSSLIEQRGLRRAPIMPVAFNFGLVHVIVLVTSP